MQPSIFGKQLNDVEYSDVVAFCNQMIKEGLGLDYKKDLSSVPNVIKALTSFANTNGGWLVIGVDDEDDKPKLPATGMDKNGDPIQQINNAIISTVSPFILPLYKECLSPDGTKSFLIVHVPQSQTAPHFMQYKKRNALFIRVADHASGEDWEQYASGSQWELLRNRRSASTALSESLIDQMKRVFESCALEADHKESIRKIMEESNPLLRAAASPARPYYPSQHYENALTVVLSPTYPSEPWMNVTQVRQMLRNDTISNGFSSPRPNTPDLRGYDPKLYQQGAYVFYPNRKSERYYFFGMDIHGNIMCVDPIVLDRPSKDDEGDPSTQYFVELSTLITSVMGMLGYAKRCYNEVGLLGDMEIILNYDGPKGAMIFKTYTDGIPFNVDDLPASVTGDFSISRKLTSDTLNDKDAMYDLAQSIVQEMLYSFNYGYDIKDSLKQFIERAGIHIS
jgi:hypothetical protein